jgi:alcohol oxidase
MKLRDQGGVVDPRLNVCGILNLKVTSPLFNKNVLTQCADCSIAPATNVAANTYNTALDIGKKAAVIIAEDLGINPREL